MTLKEKFGLILMEFWSSDWESKCEQEADDFAIGFAEWCLKIRFEPIENVSVKKLLEIYKKDNL
jgi:hypothetical protein